MWQNDRSQLLLFIQPEYIKETDNSDNCSTNFLQHCDYHKELYQLSNSIALSNKLNLNQL